MHISGYLFLFLVYQCVSYKLDIDHDLGDSSGFRSAQCSKPLKALKGTKSIIDECKRIVEDVNDTKLTENLVSEDDCLEKEYFGNMIICLYEKLGIISGRNFNVSIPKAIKVFEDGMGEDVSAFGAVGWYHDFVIPFCYNKTFYYMNETYGDDFVNVNETLLPVFYYNFFSCQERAVEFLCRYKISI